ncbi:bifunctional aminoglycoside phosphotransferase/ATP-binding protein [Trichlorobacter ammonificans]|uniref:APH domain-containing protein n=1 Tax=Trichlorobacter ammonificans TaxID=2916410 RepID=A0ABM9D8N7_9BACT|nr:AAA family ATPase [Trichlorobacter ammonificans]CAH2030925.1 APH domain-containing protein [Trichlorobacter ammonificans]
MTAEQIRQLLSAEPYPESTGTVTMSQTHISFLFFTDRHVYKIKKGINLGFLDFSTLAKRYFYCCEEVRLNRRLSPEIYLGVVAVTEEDDGRLRFEGTGKVVEYAVKMVRMPEERIMARLLERGAVTVEQIDRLARLVAGFHAEAASDAHISAYGSPEVIRQNWQENLEQTRTYIGRTITDQDHRLIAARVMAGLEAGRELLEERVRRGYVRECDGDLHSENICLDDVIHIFDCIEFNERFRCSDTAADIAFLMMDLENRGRRDLAQRFLEQYRQESGDEGCRQVLPLYLANRAFIRGKVESIRLDDPFFSASEKEEAAGRACRFFRLARGYLLRQELPLTLFITSAVSGCGKTALAGELALQLGIAHCSSDIERKRLAGIPSDQWGGAIYGSGWNRATYAALGDAAAAELAAGRSAIVDATFIRRADREPFADLARRYGAAFRILQLTCPDQVARNRIEARRAAGGSTSDATVTVYEQQRALLEPPRSDEGIIVPLDADETPTAMVDRVLEEIGLLEKMQMPEFFCIQTEKSVLG